MWMYVRFYCSLCLFPFFTILYIIVCMYACSGRLPSRGGAVYEWQAHACDGRTA